MTELIKLRVNLARIAQSLSLGHYIPSSDAISSKQKQTANINVLTALAANNQVGWDKLAAVILNYIDNLQESISDKVDTVPVNTKLNYCCRCDNFHRTVSCQINTQGGEDESA